MNDPDADVAVRGLPRATADTLWQTHKMLAVGRLSAGISHEVNNLTQRVIASLEVTRKLVLGARAAEADAYIANAIASVQDMSALSQRLARFVRPQAIAPKQTSLNAVIAELEHVLRSTMLGMFRLEIVPAADLWTTYCDGGQAEIAILDMVLAARDSIPGGGTIAIATRNDATFDAAHGSQAGSGPRHFVCVDVAAKAATLTGSFDRGAMWAATLPPTVSVDTLDMVDRFARTYGGELRHPGDASTGARTALWLPRSPGEG
jgi:hypothetical protein